MPISDTRFFQAAIRRRPSSAPPRLISEYVEGRRILPSNTPFPGPWRNAKAPYLVEFMDDASPFSPIQHSVTMKSRKIGFTTGAENIAAYWTDAYPTDWAYVSASEPLVKDWSERKFDDVIDSMGFREKWGEDGTDHIPQSYQVQVQHQMLCTGAEEVIVCVLVFPETPEAWEKMGWRVQKGHEWHDAEKWYLVRDLPGGRQESLAPARWAASLEEMGYFHQYRVKAKPEAQAAMLERYREFWTVNVLGETPPEPRKCGECAYCKATKYRPCGWFCEESLEDTSPERAACETNFAERKEVSM